MSPAVMLYRSMSAASHRPGSSRFLRVAALMLTLMSAGALVVFGIAPDQADPDLKAPDLQGNIRTLDAFSGTATVLLFWRPDAERAREAVCAVAKAVAAGYEGTHLVTIVSGAHEKAEIDPVLEHCGMPVTVLLDRDRAIFAAYQIVALPTVLVLSKDRKLKYKTAGFSHEGIADLTAQLDEVYGRKHFAAALPEGSPEAIRRHGMALQLLKTGMRAQAAELLEQLVKDHPEYRPAWVSLGYCHIASGEVEESKECLERAFALDQENPDVAAGLAWISWKLGDGTQAAKWAAMVDEKDPNASLILEVRKDSQK